MTILRLLRQPVVPDAAEGQPHRGREFVTAGLARPHVAYVARAHIFGRRRREDQVTAFGTIREGKASRLNRSDPQFRLGVHGNLLRFPPSLLHSPWRRIARSLWHLNGA